MARVRWFVSCMVRSTSTDILPLLMPLYSLWYCRADARAQPSTLPASRYRNAPDGGG